MPGEHPPLTSLEDGDYALGMYLRTMTRKNANGSVVRYLQLAHNRWDPQTKRAQAVVIHNFGREDQLDRQAIQRLIHSLARVLSPEDAARVEIELQGFKPLECLLGQVARRLAADWRARYAYEPVAIETFVDSHRFFGTSYRAAGWLCLGETTGRGRNDRHHRRTHRQPERFIFLKPLRPDYRSVLRAPLPLPGTPDHAVH